jgi:hypothetical protein
MRWKEENVFYLNDKNKINFNSKCFRCSKLCKQSCNVLALKCKHYVKAENPLSKQEQIIQFWIKDNPNGSKNRCVSDTGLSKNTVYKYWELLKKTCDFEPPVEEKAHQEISF